MSKKGYIFCPYCDGFLANAFMIDIEKIRESSELRNGVIFLGSDIACMMCHCKLIEVRQPDFGTGDVREVH